jgi:predicted dehydrogenase
MEPIDRRSFIRKSGVVTAGAIVGKPLIGRALQNRSLNDTINVAVIGIRSRGRDHYRALSKIPGVRIAKLCDIDSRLFPEVLAEVEELTGYRPATETDYRRLLEDRDIHAVSIATPNHWHALQTIWACQAGKDVYVEKPVSHTVLEGRKMVEAARKYGRVVQTGTQSRSSYSATNAMKFIKDGGLGEIYMAKGLCLKPRGNIGRVADSPVPDGVNWDAHRGPAPMRPFNLNRFHYKWHWFWDTGNGDLGNQGIHQVDYARWSLDKMTLPVRINGTGNFFVWEGDQETPNIQHLDFEYGDGKILQFEVRGLGTNPEGGVRIGNLVYGSKGWLKVASEDVGGSQAYFTEVTLQPSGFSSYREEAGPSFTEDDPASRDSVLNHFTNFFDCVRSRKWQDLHADILEGHLSSAICHLGNIATVLKRSLKFDPDTETFVNDPEADSYLTKHYRDPYILPEQV